jgi:hypothetical protein
MPGILAGLGEGAEALHTNYLQDQQNDRANQEMALKTPMLQAQGSMMQDQASESRALSPGAIEAAKRDQEKAKRMDTAIPMSQITEAHHMMKPLIDAVGPYIGIAKDAVGITPNEMKAGQDFATAHPEIPLNAMRQYHTTIDEKINNYGESVKELQEKLGKLQPGPDDKEIEEVNKKIAQTQKDMEPFKKQQEEAVQAINQFEDMQTAKQLGKMTSVQLAAASTSSNPRVADKAKKIMEAQKTAGSATEYKTFYSGFKQRNPESDDMTISQAWQKIQLDKQQNRYGKFTQIPGLLGTGFNRFTNEMVPMKLPSGVSLDQLTTQVAANKAYQNQKKQYEATMQVVNSAELDKNTLLKTSDNFSRYNYPAPNMITNWTAKQFGSQERQKEYAQFETALLAFSRKYMRVVTGAARSVAELSINAQKGSDIISKFDSWEVLKARIEQAQKEINNEQTGYLNGMDALKDELAKFGGASKKSDPAGLR